MYLIILSFITLAVALVWYLLKHDHGRSLPVGSLWAAFGFGVLAMVIAAIAEQLLFPNTLWRDPHSLSLGRSFVLFLGIGFLEEAAKFLPLAFFIYRKAYFREHTDGVIYFAIGGLAFGLGENILYALSYGVQVGVERLILTPFLHAATTGILGYYLVNMKIAPQNRGKFILACLLLPLLHGFYDFGLSSGILQLIVISVMITLLLALGLFLYFMTANDLDKRAATRRLQVMPKNFCIACGKPNGNHTSFCEYCGHPL